MTVLLTLITAFGYFLGAVMLSALVAYTFRSQITEALDATIDWPNTEEPQSTKEIRTRVAVAYCRLDAQINEIVTLNEIADAIVPAWVPTPTLEIIREHPLGKSNGFEEAYNRWRSLRDTLPPTPPMVDSNRATVAHERIN